MNHKAIVVKQMNEEATQLRSRLAELEAGIRVLGGTVAGAIPSIQRRRRGPNKPKEANATPKAPKSAGKGSSPNAEVLAPALQAELDKIKASNLSPIQKAQASRKARAAHRTAAAQTPAPQQGAGLAEAAAS